MQVRVPSTLWMDRVGLRFVEKGVLWSDIADGWTRRCRVTAGKCVQKCTSPGSGRPSHPIPSPMPSISMIAPSQSFHSHLSARVLINRQSTAAGCDDSQLGVFLYSLV